MRRTRRDARRPRAARPRRRRGRPQRRCRIGGRRRARARRGSLGATTGAGADGVGRGAASPVGRATRALPESVATTGSAAGRAPDGVSPTRPRRRDGGPVVPSAPRRDARRRRDARASREAPSVAHHRGRPPGRPTPAAESRVALVTDRRALASRSSASPSRNRSPMRSGTPGVASVSVPSSRKRITPFVESRSDHHTRRRAARGGRASWTSCGSRRRSARAARRGSRGRPTGGGR